MQTPAYQNTVLRNLSPEIVSKLELTKVKLPLLREIEFPGNEINNLFFIESGVASMTTTFLDGSQVEIALAGSESVLGASALLGTRRSLNRVYMQIAGWGYASRVPIAQREFERQSEFHRLVLRYTQAQFIQSAQTAACNARHNVQQRLARWLLLCQDRVNGGPVLLSQEFLGEMLGSRRTSVSTEAGKLQKLRLIEYARGKIVITDRQGLERKACECYAIVRDHLANYASSDEGMGV